MIHVIPRGSNEGIHVTRADIEYDATDSHLSATTDDSRRNRPTTYVLLIDVRTNACPSLQRLQLKEERASTRKIWNCVDGQGL